MTSLKHEIKFNISKLQDGDGHGSVISTGGSFSGLVDTVDDMGGSEEFLASPRSNRRRYVESKIARARCVVQIVQIELYPHKTSIKMHQSNLNLISLSLN